MFTKNLKDQFSADLLNTVRSILGEAKKCSEECTCEKCESEKEEVKEEKSGKQHIEVTHITGEKSKKPVHPDNAFKALNHYKSLSTTKSARIVSEEVEEIEEKRGLWDNIHAKRERIKAGSGERMRKPGSKGAPTDADFRAASEEVELEEGQMKELITKHMDAGHDYDAAMKKAKKDLEKMKEEFEQIDELSKGTLGKYINKAKDSVDITAWRQGYKEAGAGSPSGRLEKKLTKRHKGIETAVKKLTKEESEQIDELSSDLKTRYGIKAYDQLVAAQRTARDSDNNPAIRKLAANIARKRKAGVDRRSRQYAQDVEKQRRTYGVNKEEFEQIDELSKKTLGNYVYKATSQVGEKGITAGLKVGDREDASKEFKTMGKRQKGVAKAVSKLTKEEQEFIDALNNDMFEEIEIAEANLKVGDYTATSEKSKFHDKGYRPHLKNPQGKTSYLAGVAYKSPEHAAGEAAAYHKGYFGSGRPSERGADDAVRAYRHKNKEHMHEETIVEAEAWHVKLNGKRVSRHFDSEDHAKRFAEYGKSTQKGKFTVHKSVAEEVELEEGRGRPPKEGSAAWHAKQKQADDDMVALGMQLRKAKSINKKVRFMDGKEHDIHPNHINRFDDHMAARRTSQEKAAFQKQAHKSHADFVKAVSAPVPKSSKDTGEIVKYRH